MKNQQEYRGVAHSALIDIVGNNMLQNELLLSFLKNSIGIKGKCISSLEPKSLTSKNRSIPSTFILIDCKTSIWKIV